MNKRSKNIMKIILVLIYLVLTVSGLILMKKGGNSGNIAIEKQTFNFNINLISALGFICYLFSFLLYTKIIVMFDLSYITPICTGIVQILILIASKLVFKENFTTTSVTGATIIIIGVIIMNLPKNTI